MFELALGPEDGDIDLMPTMMIGTIRPSVLSAPFSPFSAFAFWFWSGLVGPNLNMRKKFSGPCSVLPFSPSELPPRSADAIRPFCSALRNPSKLPSSPLPPMSPMPAPPVRDRASLRACASSPMSVAAVAAAAIDSRRLSIEAWSSCPPMRRTEDGGGDLRLRKEARCLKGLSGLSELRARKLGRRMEPEDRGGGGGGCSVSVGGTKGS